MSKAVRLQRHWLSVAPHPVISSSIRISSSRLTQQSPSLFRSTTQTLPHKRFAATKMSFSNADTGDKPADPYKAVNKTEPELAEKIEDLVGFIEQCKYGMMTTRIASSGLLVSRCMALAAKVRLKDAVFFAPIPMLTCANRRVVASTFSSTPIPNPAKPMT